MSTTSVDNDTPAARKTRRVLEDRDLLAAACHIVACEGLVGLTLRPLAQALGVSVTVLSKRYGARLDVLAAIGRAACAEEQASLAPWHSKLAALGHLQPQTAADLAEALLEELAVRRREFSLLFVELMQACAWDAELRPVCADWFATRAAFWTALGTAAGLPRGVLSSGLLNGYFVDELAYSLTLTPLPAYRMLRRLGLRRLLGGLAARPEAANEPALFRLLVDDLNYPPGALTVIHGAALASDWRRRAAQVCAVLITTRGVGAVTHRAIAAAADVAHTTLAYRYPTQQDLVVAGLEHIISITLEQVEKADFRNGLTQPAETPQIHIGRATFAVAIAAARMPQLVACAADMRRQRGINLFRILEQRGDTARGLDALSAQVISIGVTGLLVGIPDAAESSALIERAFVAAVDWAA